MKKQQSAVSSQQSAVSRTSSLSLTAAFFRALALGLALVFALPAQGLAQTTGQQTAPETKAQQSAPQQTPALGLAPPSQHAAAQDVAAQQAALVTEFEVNGLKVLVKRREGSQTVAAGLFLRGGARNIIAQNAGIEGLMWDVATEASASFPRERLRVEQARMGTVVSYGLNYDYSALSLRSTRRHFDRSWEMFVDLALRPTFAREDFQRVQHRLVTGLRDDASDPDSFLQRLQERAAYAGHPYLNRPRGTDETIARLTLDDVRAYHRQMMETSRLLLVIVGDLDPADVRRRVTASFGQLPRGNYRPQAAPALAFTTPTVEVASRPLPTNYIQGTYAAPALTSRDIYAMRIASSVLHDRVFEEVRVRRNLSYAPSAFLGNQGANIGGIYVTAVDANQAVSVMLNEVARLQSVPISQQEITAAVSQYLTGYYMDQETNAAQAAELASYELIGGGWRNSLAFLERLRAVTPADVQRVAQTYMRNMRFVVVGDPARIDRAVFTRQLVTATTGS